MPAAGRVASRNAWPSACRTATSSPWMDRRRWSTARANDWRGSAIGSSTSSRTSAGPCRSRIRSTRSSRPRHSTGCPTTTRCSGTSPPSRSRAAGSSPSAAGPAISRRSFACLPRSATAGSVRCISRRPTTRNGDSPRPATWTSPAGCRRRPSGSRPASRSRRTCGRSSWARHLERLPATEHDAFVRAVADGLGKPVIDYVRLNITARRG